VRTLLGITLLAACPGIAADQDFNGRWDLTALTQPRPRAWWLASFHPPGRRRYHPIGHAQIG